MHDVLQRMFRASITNDAPTGHGVARESVENLYATENALRHIGAYILVFETSKANFPDSFDSLRCYRFGSCQGYMLGFVEWNEKEHHALINTQRNLATKAELVSENHFAPWDLGYVGSSKSSSSSSVWISGVQNTEAACLNVYELQPLDLGKNKLKLSSKSGVLVSPYQAVGDMGEVFSSALTNGDGGCALHAVWGAPHGQYGLSLPCGQVEGRRLCCSMLPDSWETANAQVGNWEVFEQISLSLWSELAEPGAR